MKLGLILTTLLCAITFAGCNSSTNQAASSQSESLAGTYGAMDPKTGEVKPFVKIEASDTDKGTYVLYEFGKSGWHRPKKAWSDSQDFQPVKRFEKADLEKMVHHTVDVDVSGVQVPSFAVVRVPAGWTDQSGSHPFATKSGVFALTLLGPIDLVRM